MGARGARLAVALLTVLACAGGVRGQMGYSFASLEWLVADADEVASGVVVEVADGAEQHGLPWSVVTLETKETLKGTRARQFRFLASTWPTKLREWKESGTELLWFLKRKKRGVPDAETLAGVPTDDLLARSGTDRYASTLYFPPVVPLGLRAADDRRPPPPVLTLDFQLLAAREEILKAAAAAAAGEGRKRPARAHQMDLPREIAQRTGSSGDVNRFTVPIDRRLEAFARRLVRSPGSFLRKGEEPFRDLLRLEGVKALRYFRSRRNAALLTPLVSDPAFRIEHGPGDVPPRRVYYLREAASRTLRAWGFQPGGGRGRPPNVLPLTDLKGQPGVAGPAVTSRPARG